MKEVNPKETSRAQQFEIWKNAPNPMLTFVKKMDVTNLVRISKKRHLKFNMLLDYCIGKAAIGQKEFYLLPVGKKLMQFDRYNLDYLKYTAEVAQSCVDRDLSEDYMVIGTSAVIDTELEFGGGMYSGIYNNPYIIWGRYSRHFFRYYLNISFQFHHTQMDGAHAAHFLTNIQKEIDKMR